MNDDKMRKLFIIFVAVIVLFSLIMPLVMVKRYPSDFWLKVYFGVHGVRDADVNVVVPGTDGCLNLYFPDGCDTTLLRGIRQIRRVSGGFGTFDLKDIEECRKLEFLSVPMALLKNEQQLFRYGKGLCVCGITESVDLRLWRHIADQRWGIMLLANMENIESVVDNEISKSAHDLLIPRKVFSALTYEQHERLKKCHYDTINYCRSDYFWEHAERDSGTNTLVWCENLYSEPRL